MASRLKQRINRRLPRVWRMCEHRWCTAAAIYDYRCGRHAGDLMDAGETCVPMVAAGDVPVWRELASQAARAALLLLAVALFGWAVLRAVELLRDIATTG